MWCEPSLSLSSLIPLFKTSKYLDSDQPFKIFQIILNINGPEQNSSSSIFILDKKTSNGWKCFCFLLLQNKTFSFASLCLSCFRMRMKKLSLARRSDRSTQLGSDGGSSGRVLVCKPNGYRFISRWKQDLRYHPSSWNHSNNLNFIEAVSCQLVISDMVKSSTNGSTMA